MSNPIVFKLDGCDISFVAEAPEDITLKELLDQTDKIEPDWCACGIRRLSKSELEYGYRPEIIITKDSIRLADEDVCAKIHEDGSWMDED